MFLTSLVHSGAISCPAADFALWCFLVPEVSEKVAERLSMQQATWGKVSLLYSDLESQAICISPLLWYLFDHF